MKGWPGNCSQMKALGCKQIYWKLVPWHQCRDLHKRVFCSHQSSGFAYVFIPIKLGSISCLWRHLNMHLTVQTGSLEGDDGQNVKKEPRSQHRFNAYIFSRSCNFIKPCADFQNVKQWMRCITAGVFFSGRGKSNRPIYIFKHETSCQLQSKLT